MFFLNFEHFEYFELGLCQTGSLEEPTLADKVNIVLQVGGKKKKKN